MTILINDALQFRRNNFYHGHKYRHIQGRSTVYIKGGGLSLRGSDGRNELKVLPVCELSYGLVKGRHASHVIPKLMYILQHHMNYRFSVTWR